LKEAQNLYTLKKVKKKMSYNMVPESEVISYSDDISLLFRVVIT